MSTLLLRCAGPMQSWGTRSRFTERDTEREPSKSGIVGLLCAALGRDRTESVDDLAALRMGVRVDREGELRRDYQTALEVRKADPDASPGSVVSNRYYLSDAVFLVGLEGPGALIVALDRALAAPVRPLFLGRKSYVPSETVRLMDGLRAEEDLVTALQRYPMLRNPDGREEHLQLRVVLECGASEGGEGRQDVPVSFAPGGRRFGLRWVKNEWVPLPTKRKEGERCF